MAEFSIELQPLTLPDTNPNGDILKNVKEIKSGDGTFYISPTGTLELRDSSGNIVILLDPNG